MRLSDIRAKVVGATAFIAQVCRDLGIADKVNRMVEWDQKQWKLSPGTRVVALIINIICHRQPLYRVWEFYEHLDLGLLFDQPVTLEDLNDDGFARTLDRLHASGVKAGTKCPKRVCGQNPGPKRRMSVYSREERMKAVKLYFQYDRQVAPVLRELGYASRGALRRWVAEFEATGDVHAGYRRERHPSKYSEAQKRAAVDYYLTHGRNLQQTVRALGYPDRHTLRQWLNARVEDRAHPRTGRVYKPSAKLSAEEKQEPVIDLCSREGQAREAAKKYGVTRAALYRWKSQLLGSGSPVKRRSANGGPQSSRDTNELESEVESLSRPERNAPRPSEQSSPKTPV